MSKFGPILIVDDDADDQDLIRDVCARLKMTNELLFFDNGSEVIKYLEDVSETPFLILCDVNMPLVDGLELRKRLNEHEIQRPRGIPFVFLSTASRQQDVDTAYGMAVQGYFEKGHDFDKLRHRLAVIFEYWKECKHPKCFLSDHEER